MPAPTAAQMREQAKTIYGQQFGEEGKEYMTLLFDKISKAWDTWQKSIVFGGLLIDGGGMGGWSGLGNGGTMTASAFILEPFGFKNNSSQQLNFTKALADALKQKFAPFPASFSFKAVPYTGTSGASPVSGGPVSATCSPVTLAVAGKGTNPSGIAEAWSQALTPPEFQLDNPNAKSGELIKAIGKTIEQSFQSVWLMTTVLDGNSLAGGGAPGGVVSGFPSETNGKLV